MTDAVVRPARPDETATLRQLLREYGQAAEQAIGRDLSFDAFGDELAALPGRYAEEQRGAILLAEASGAVIGCVALRGLDEETCELKRLYVRPGTQGRGVGAMLVGGVIDRGRQLGYARMRLDTHISMLAAQALYVRFGFTEIPSYGHGLPPGQARYFELELWGAGDGRRQGGVIGAMSPESRRGAGP